MGYPERLHDACKKYLGKRVNFGPHWDTRGDSWLSGNAPVLVMWHHTAGVGPGVREWVIHRGSSHAWANAYIARSGEVTICGAKAQWHAGLGTFKGTRWRRWAIPADQANRHTFGVEIESWGKKRDFTDAQWESIAALSCALREAGRWDGFKYRHANHRNWARKRKSDTLYPWRKFYRLAKKAWKKKAA